MGFTGKFGTSDSKLGNLKLGSSGAPALTYGSGQAQCYIQRRAFGQAQCHITTTTPNGQAQVFISKSAGYGQAQAQLLGVVIWTRFEESSGTSLADSADSNTMTLDSTTSVSYHAANFDPNPDTQSYAIQLSADRYAQNGSPNNIPVGSAARTVEGWIKTNTSNTNKQTLISYGTSGQLRQSFSLVINDFVSGSTPNVGFWVWSDDHVFSANASDGNWHHVALTYAAGSSQIKVYFDGSLLGTGSLGGALNTVLSGTGLIYFRDHHQGANYVRGTVDDFRIWNIEITAQTIADIYAQKFHRAYGQAQVQVRAPFAFGQAQAYILTKVRHGQAQALIDKPIRNAQVNALIEVRPVIFWKLDETSGTLIDSADSTNLTPQGSPIYSVGGFNQNSNAITFSGGAYANNGAPNAVLPTGSSARSYEMWFKTTSTGRMVLLSHGTAITRQAFNASLNHDHNNQIGYWSWSDDSFFNATVSDGLWHHLVYTYAASATQIKIYYDGSLYATGSLGGALNTASGTTLSIANSIAFSEFFDGTLDNVKIYNFELTADQVAAKYGEKITGYGQAQAVISTTFGFGLALANINRALQAANANADIKRTSYQSGQAFASIRRTFNGSGQAFAYILPPTFWGQANAQIIAFDVPRSGNANADIQVTQNRYAQAQAKITKTQGNGQATADIKTSLYGKQNGQARAQITKTQGFGQAQTLMIKAQGHAQAQALIKTIVYNSAQAQALIIRHEGYGQANADILKTQYAFGQCQALIDDRFALAQALASIVRTFFQPAQAKADIKTTINRSAQANAKIIYKIKAFGQAQALITRTYWASCQALAFIGSYQTGQAQAYLKAFNYVRYAQAQADIIGNTVTPPTPTSTNQTFIIKYNNYNLPGYAQKEADDSTESIFTSYTPYIQKSSSELTGLVNKGLSLNMLVWESSYALCKAQVKRAVNFLRTAKTFKKLYVGNLNDYYLAIPTEISIEKSVPASPRTLAYEVTFNCKPWVYSNDLYQFTGTEEVVTTGRTLLDGTWTPVRLMVTGEDIIIRGITETGLETGLIEISGFAESLLIDSEEHTAFMSGVSRLDMITNKDFYLYVGPGVTTFTITGATNCIIQFQNRWPLNGGSTTKSLQPVTDTPLVSTRVLPPLGLNLMYGQAAAQIDNFIHYASGQARAVIESPIKDRSGQAAAQIRQSRFRVYAQAEAFIRSPKTLKFGQAQVSIRPHTRVHGQARTSVRTPRVKVFGQARTFIKKRVVAVHGLAKASIKTTSTTISPSGQPMPTLDPAGWTRMFQDDFNNGTFAEGSFISGNGKWTAYPDGWLDTSKNGHYTPNVFSQHDGMLDVHMRMINGVWRVGTLRPTLPSATTFPNQHKKVRVEVRFKATPTIGFKTAWLFWPDDENWPYNGEIDFPEGNLESTIHAYMHRQGACQTCYGDQDAYATTATYTSWHTAVTEWEMGVYCKFYLDGTLIGNSTNRVPATPMHYDLQSETRLSGGPPPTGADAHIYVDWFVMWTK